MQKLSRLSGVSPLNGTRILLLHRILRCFPRLADVTRHKRRDLANLVLLLMLTGTVSAQTTDAAAADPLLSSIHSQTQQYLFGDWGGKRSALAEKGITFDFFYISDLLANPSGGVQQTQGGWERARGTIDVNFDRLMQWQGLRFHATGLWQSGVNLGGKIGSIANPSDLVSAHTTRLDSFWLEQNFLSNKIRIRAGQLV